MRKVLFIFGTRPEAIKMAPIILELQKHKELFDCKVCTTGQHKEMLQQVMDYFGLKADYELSIMVPNQTLFTVTSLALTNLESILESCNPDIVLVQGDTTTAFVGGLAAYYKKIKVGHVEAGLRSGDKYAPFPEEMNRKMLTSVADIHFAPTLQAVENLHKENITDNVYHTGNTVIDALLIAADKVKQDKQLDAQFSFLDDQKKTILVTGHRRENFGKPFENICNAIKYLADKYEDVQFVYPVHLNPNVRGIVHQVLDNHPRIHLIEPLGYPELVWLMNRCSFVLTDSGGIQEEAPALGKPVLVMREVTERMEGVQAGNAKLVGTDKDLIISSCEALIEDAQVYDSMSKALNPYGDGTSAKQIVAILKEML